MDDISVRKLFRCVGVDRSNDLSVLRRLFGFFRGEVPPDPDSTVTASVSLRRFADGVRGDHIHINVIKMGFDAMSASDLDVARISVDYCIYRIRKIYRPQGVGVGRVLHYAVDAAGAAGFDVIVGEDEAQDMYRAFAVFNDGLDAFIVRSISGGLLGRSPVEGDCDKDSKDAGLCAGGVNDDAEGLSRTFAHEIGHFLGLEHNHDDDSCPSTTAGRNNLMAQTGCVLPGKGGVPDRRNSVRLSSSQGDVMDDHCSIKGGC